MQFLKKKQKKFHSGPVLAFSVPSIERITMATIFIKQGIFDLSQAISASLHNRMLPVSVIGQVQEGTAYDLSQGNNTFVCSNAWEESIGGQQALLEKGRNFKAKKIVVVHENSKNYKIESHLGGNLVRFFLTEIEEQQNNHQDFQLQLLLSIIQSKEDMTAGDVSSHQLLKLSKKVSEADVTVFINGPN